MHLNSNLTADGTPFRFGKDAEGNFGYIITDETGADSVVPFSASAFGDAIASTTNYLTFRIGFKPKIIVVIATNGSGTNLVSIYNESVSTENIIGIANSIESIPLADVESGIYRNNIRSILDNGFTVSNYQQSFTLRYYAFG